MRSSLAQLLVFSSGQSLFPISRNPFGANILAHGNQCSQQATGLKTGDSVGRSGNGRWWETPTPESQGQSDTAARKGNFKRRVFEPAIIKTSSVVTGDPADKGLWGLWEKASVCQSETKIRSPKQLAPSPDEVGWVLNSFIHANSNSLRKGFFYCKKGSYQKEIESGKQNNVSKCLPSWGFWPQKVICGPTNKYSSMSNLSRWTLRLTPEWGVFESCQQGFHPNWSHPADILHQLNLWIIYLKNNWKQIAFVPRPTKNPFLTGLTRTRVSEKYL